MSIIDDKLAEYDSELLVAKAAIAGATTVPPTTAAQLAAAIRAILLAGASILAFTQDGAGAVPRTMQEEMRERVSVTQFMSAEERNNAYLRIGSVDMTASIQKAVNFAAGRALVVPAGAYLVSDTIQIPSNIRVMGEGTSSVFKLKAASNKFMFQNAAYLSGTNENIVFENLVIDGNNSQQTIGGAYRSAFRMRGVTGLEVRNCEMRNSSTDSINLINCPYAVISHNHMYGAHNAGLVFENCTGLLAEYNRIHDCGSKTDEYGYPASGHAIIGVNVPSQEVRILGNYVHDMGDTCLRNEPGGIGWVIANNIVARSGKDSIKIMGKTYTGVRQLYLDTVAGFAVGNVITSGSSIATATVTAVNPVTNIITVAMGGSATSYASFKLGDVVTGSGGSATIQSIASLMAKANIIANNVIIDAGNHGIVANGDAPTTIIGNAIFGTGKNTAGAPYSKWFASAGGISVTDNSSDILIQGNVVTGAYASAMTFDDAYRLCARGNFLFENGENGILASRCTFLSIHDNAAYDNSKRVANTYAGIYIGDFAGAAGAVYSRHSIKRNRCFNTTTVGQLWGLRLEGGSKVSNSSVKDNEVFGNTNPAQIFSNWSGTGNTIAMNEGYATENRGTAVIPSGATLVAVPHGLRVTPSVDKISVTPTNSMGSAAKFWIGSINTTVFQIYVNADPGVATATFAWQITA